MKINLIVLMVLFFMSQQIRLVSDENLKIVNDKDKKPVILSPKYWK